MIQVSDGGFQAGFVEKTVGLRLWGLPAPFLKSILVHMLSFIPGRVFERGEQSSGWRVV